MFDKNEYQVAGQSMAAFVNEMVQYIEQGFVPDADTATHYWPSTFVVTMLRTQAKQQEPVDNKPVRQQRRQKSLDEQD